MCIIEKSFFKLLICLRTSVNQTFGYLIKFVQMVNVYIFSAADSQILLRSIIS